MPRKGKLNSLEAELASIILYYDSEELLRFFDIFNEILSDEYMAVDGTFTLFVHWVQDWFRSVTAEEIDQMTPERRKGSMIQFVQMCNSCRPNSSEVESFELWLQSVLEKRIPTLLADEIRDRFVWERYKEAVLRIDQSNIPFKDKLAVRPHAPNALSNNGIYKLSDVPFEREEAKSKFTSGLKGLDKVLNIYPGAFMIVGARPGVGKSLFMLQMALENCQRGIRCLYCSLEMTKRQINERVINYCAGSSVREQFLDENGFLDNDGYEEAIERVKSGKKFKIIDEYLDVLTDTESSADITMTKLENSSKEKHYGIIFIDYLQLLQFSGMDEWASIRRSTKELKKMALRLQATIVSGSQVSRASTERGLYLSDMYGGQTIESDTDIVLGMEEVRERKQGPKAIINFKLMKNRDGDRSENRFMVNYTNGMITPAGD